MSTETIETKVTEYGDGSEIVETVTTETTFEPGDNPAPEIIVEPIEESVSDTVAIAAIEADAVVQVEQIRADTSTELAIIESKQRDNEPWQNQLTELARTVAQLAETVAALASGQVSIQPNSTELAALEAVEELASNSMPVSTLEQTSETATAVTLESEGVKPVEVAATVRKRRRLI